jgi:hypothetical protein
MSDVQKPAEETPATEPTSTEPTATVEATPAPQPKDQNTRSGTAGEILPRRYHTKLPIYSGVSKWSFDFDLGMQKRVLRQLDHSACEASIETKETTQIPSFVYSYSKQQFHRLVNGLKL